MSGVKNSAYLFFLSGILLIIQAGVSLGPLDDWLGAMVAGTIAFIMFVGGAFAWTGGLSAVTQLEYEEDWGHTKVQHWRDTGQRVQCTPCFGFCGGIGTIIVAFIFAEPLFSAYGDGGIA